MNGLDKQELLHILDNSDLVPKPSKDISDIFKILNNPIDSDIDILVEKISKIDKLNELMMKNLNTGYFKTNRELTSIKDAIVFFGMETVQNLLTFFITMELFSYSPTNENRVFKMDIYLKHVLGTAIASSMLSSHLKTADKYKLFSYGLIHDIGVALLDTCVPNCLDQVTQKLKKGIHQVIAERSIFGGITHAEVGGWLCRKWNIRRDITDIVEFHHMPFLSENTTDELKLVCIADVISTMYYERLLGVNLNHRMNKRIMNDLGISEDIINYIGKKLPDEVSKSGYYLIIN